MFLLFDFICSSVFLLCYILCFYSLRFFSFIILLLFRCFNFAVIQRSYFLYPSWFLFFYSSYFLFFFFSYLQIFWFLVFCSSILLFFCSFESTIFLFCYYVPSVTFTVSLLSCFLHFCRLYSFFFLFFNNQGYKLLTLFVIGKCLLTLNKFETH